MTFCPYEVDPGFLNPSGEWIPESYYKPWEISMCSHTPCTQFILEFHKVSCTMGITDDCMLPCGCWELNPHLLQEQQVILISMPLHTVLFPLWHHVNYVFIYKCETGNNATWKGGPRYFIEYRNHLLGSALWSPQRPGSKRVIYFLFPFLSLTCPTYLCPRPSPLQFPL